MPLFEYVCNDCRKSFERIVPRYDSPADCPHCNSTRVEKQLSVFAVAGSKSDGASDFAGSEGGCGRCGAAEPGMCQMD
jgi:putative FmdB family regulatory protein